MILEMRLFGKINNLFFYSKGAKMQDLWILWLDGVQNKMQRFLPIITPRFSEEIIFGDFQTLCGWMQHCVYSDNFYRNWSWFSGKAALLRFCQENFCPLVCQQQQRHLARIADIFQKCLRTRKEEEENLLSSLDKYKRRGGKWRQGWFCFWIWTHWEFHQKESILKIEVLNLPLIVMIHQNILLFVMYEI